MGTPLWELVSLWILVGATEFRHSRATGRTTDAYSDLKRIVSLARILRGIIILEYLVLRTFILSPILTIPHGYVGPDQTETSRDNTQASHGCRFC
jgi:hypothetical protein